MLDFSWSNILSSNAFNFAVMVLLFAILIKFLKLPQRLEEQRTSIQQTVEASDDLKNDAKEALSAVEKSLESLPDEIQEIMKKADETSIAFEAKSRDEIEHLVESIKDSAHRQVVAEEKQTQSILSKNVGKASVDIANKQVKKAFENNSELHRKFISDFINSIDKLEI